MGLRFLNPKGYMSGPESCSWGGRVGVGKNHRLLRRNEDTGRWAEVATTSHGQPDIYDLM